MPKRGQFVVWLSRSKEDRWTKKEGPLEAGLSIVYLATAQTIAMLSSAGADESDEAEPTEACQHHSQVGRPGTPGTVR